MATEKSPYEGTFDQRLSGQTCLGRIVSVDALDRTCRVKTIGVKGRTDDLDILDVQWINLAVHDEGDEETVIPRVGQKGIIIFINSQPYILGYFRSIQTPDGTPTELSQDEKLVTSGDRIIKTVSGNRIILRSGGTVEIESNKICRTLWIPSRNLINNICGDYELETEGGFMYWTRNKDTDETTLRFFIYDRLTALNAVDLQFGTSSNGNLLDIQIGSLNPVNYEFLIRQFALSVTPQGDTKLEIGGPVPTFTTEVTATTGDAKIDTKGNVDLSAIGNVSATIGGNISASVGGNLETTLGGNLEATVAGNAKVSAVGDIELKDVLQSGLKISKGKVALGGVAAELLSLLNETLTQIPLITVPTVLGPSGPPANAPAFAAIQAKLLLIMGTL